MTFNKYTLISWLPLIIIWTAYVIWLAILEQFEVILFLFLLIIYFFLFTKWFGYWDKKSLEVKGEKR